MFAVQLDHGCTAVSFRCCVLCRQANAAGEAAEMLGSKLKGVGRFARGFSKKGLDKSGGGGGGGSGGKFNAGGFFDD